MVKISNEDPSVLADGAKYKQEFITKLSEELNNRSKLESKNSSFTVEGLSSKLSLPIDEVKLFVDVLQSLNFVAKLSDTEYFVHLSFSDRYGLYPQDTINLISDSLFFEPSAQKPVEPNIQEELSDIPQGLIVEVLQLLAKRQRDEATEMIVDFIMETERIYTTRDDNAAEMWIYHKGIYVPQGETYVREYVRKILGLAYSNPIVNRVVSKIQADSYIDQEKFFIEEEPHLLPVRNGVLNLKTKKLQAFSPDYTFFSKLPSIFDQSKDCPKIKKFLSQVLETEGDVTVIQEVFGYVLYREHFIERAFMLLGDGRNGKGKTMTLIKSLVGIENCVEVSLEELESDQYSLGALFKKLVNLCGDISKKALNHTGRFKKVTGRDQLSAQRKYKTRVTFENYSKQIFAANELPVAYDTSFAFFNRWIILDFPYTFVTPEELAVLDNKDGTYKLRDPNVIENLLCDEELSGVLNWALEGLTRLFENGDFSYSPSTESTKTKWIRCSDSCSAFIMDHIEADFDEHITKAELRATYARYCREHKLRVSGNKAIKDLMETQAGAFEDRLSDEKRTNVWKGVKLKVNGQVGASGQGIPKSPNEINTYIKVEKRCKTSTLSTPFGIFNISDLFPTEESIQYSEFAERLGTTTSDELFEKYVKTLLKFGTLYEPQEGSLRLLEK